MDAVRTETRHSSPRHLSRKTATVLARSLTHLVLLGGSVVFMSPLVLMISTSLKAMRQIVIFPPILIPDPVVWQNYSDVFRYAPFHKYLINTLIISAPAVLGAVVTSSLAAYAFARLRAPGREAIFLLVLSTMMLPAMVTMVPTFIIFAKIDWVGTFLPLTVPALFGSAYFIFLLRQFFLTIPRELEDAALIDGSSWFGIWWKIILPLSKPALATVGVFAFTGAWNELMGPLIYLNKRSLYTLSLGLRAFSSLESTEWGLLMAASTMMAAPIIVLFFFAQRQFVQGIALTGIKG